MSRRYADDDDDVDGDANCADARPDAVSGVVSYLNRTTARRCHDHPRIYVYIGLEQQVRARSRRNSSGV